MMPGRVCLFSLLASFSLPDSSSFFFFFFFFTCGLFGSGLTRYPGGVGID